MDFCHGEDSVLLGCTHGCLLQHQLHLCHHCHDGELDETVGSTEGGRGGDRKEGEGEHGGRRESRWEIKNVEIMRVGRDREVR